MKLLLAAFFGLSVGILVMGGTVYQVQENIIFIVVLYGLRKLFDKMFLEPIAERMNLPVKGMVTRLAVSKLKNIKGVEHYLSEHNGLSNTCLNCQKLPLV